MVENGIACRETLISSSLDFVAAGFPVILPSGLFLYWVAVARSAICAGGETVDGEYYAPFEQ